MTEPRRGKLKIYMGYAAGVGKTFKMLEEAQELRAAGVDVVIGYFEPHGRQETIAKTEGLELIPRKKVEYRGTMLRGDGHGRDPGEAAESLSGGRVSAHQRSRAPNARSAGRTSRYCWGPGSTFSPR